ncbi:MAG: NUDIX hydrolase [Deltaproteobacteria bacterium]|nr:NUDIX hydrolase [Deltaproteobacteria bacterium]MBI3389802.1 NUDIX hydrolase [Deltaproteobacteria bacterium]
MADGADHPAADCERYCVRCGGALAPRQLKAVEPLRLVCECCAYVHYPDPKVAACVICTVDGKVVLLRRAIEPSYGQWVFPGGFLDRGEELEAAAAREAHEEVNVVVQVRRLLNVYSYPGHPVVVVVYVADIVAGVPSVGDEALEVRTFARSEIPWGELAFPSTRQALRDYFGVSSDE